MRAWLFLKNKHKWKNPDSKNARRNRRRVTDEEPKRFGDDELPRPPDKQRIAKSQRSINSSTGSGSNLTMIQDMLQQQYELDRAAKMECMARETDANAPIEDRVKDLLSRMTLQEKLGQMAQIDRAVATPDVLRDLCIGSVLSGGGSKPFLKATSADWADMVDRFQKGALESRLGIPMFYGSDAVHGNNNVYGATVFPHNVGLGATRDPDLVERIGAATALETRASGVQYAFAPCVAVCRDPRWGRCYESYSEDTDLVRQMTTSVTGLQGRPPQDHPYGYPYVAGRNNVIACAKHYVGDGGTNKGKNEGNTIISYEDLEKIHMLPYQDCISKGVCTVMASYSSWNGTKMHAHRYLLTDILKEKLGFKGVVITDWEALDRFHYPHGSNYRRSVSIAVNAGFDMVMVPFRYQLFLEDLEYLVESGEVPMSRIDGAVERILRVKFAAGLFEYPMADRSLLDIVGCKQHRELAREAVRKSLVLLKNGKEPRKPFLPLDRNAKRVLVAGKHADDLGFQCGGTTILNAIREASGENTEVVYKENPTTEGISRQNFAYAIVVVGEAPYAESDGDNSELTIPFNGNELLKLVAGKIPTLAILISGRPLVLEPSVLEKLDALVAAWLPGSEGNGITDVIFGDYEFHGQLPVSWFRTVDQLPMDAHQNSYDPLFPLGGIGARFKMMKKKKKKKKKRFIEKFEFERFVWLRICICLFELNLESSVPVESLDVLIRLFGI
nr:beta-glucosidase BoGH3B-like [Tanacetum cinerariifolium]